MNKYDSRVDTKNAARRMSLWNTCETLGLLYREGLLDLEIIYASSSGIIYTIWKKFEPIIESYRGGDIPGMLTVTSSI